MIGGWVLDPSALAAYLRGSIGIRSWMATAKTHAMTLYLPAAALSEVRWVFPDRLEQLSGLLGHSQVYYRELSPTDAPAVVRLLDEAGCFDPTAGHVILIARQRGWPVLTSDPGRLQRIAPDLDVDLL